MNNLQAWVSDSTECIELALILPTTNLIFSPHFTYQSFEGEKIFGYKDLHIKLHFTSGSLRSYFNLTWGDVISGAEPQDVSLGFTGFEYTTNHQEFLRLVESEYKSFMPMGEKVHEYTSGGTLFEYYKCDFETRRFKEYHDRLQQFLPFFIEGSTFIEADDVRWQIILIFKKNTGGAGYETVGYATYYPFFHYPDLIRMRISQFLILPPYQSCGHGTKLYEYLYLSFKENSSVVDITVEDPNDAFQDLRDRCDVKMLLKSNSITGLTPKVITKSQITEIQRQSKLCLRQAIRCIEMIFLKKTSKWDCKAMKEYRLFVKRRIYLKNKEALEEMEFGEVFLQLEQTYQNVENDYIDLLKHID